MRPDLLKELACIDCGGALRLEVFRSEAGLWGGKEIADGRLDCACGAAYPIIAGVPRLVAPEFTLDWAHRYPEYFARYAGRQTTNDQRPTTKRSQRAVRPRPLAGVRRSSFVVRRPSFVADDPALRTARSFSYEWEQFGALRPEWEANFWGYMAPLSVQDLAGQRVLDAGCGSGRHAYHAGRAGAEVYAVDLGESVDIAYRNTAAMAHVHIVQADLRRLPFRAEAFDRIYSLGVLHHLEEPEAAFRGLLTHLRPGGEMRVYLYSALEHAPAWQRALLGGVTAARWVTTRLPHPVLHALSYPIAAAAYSAFVLPYRALARSRTTRALAESLPLRQYAAYPFSVCVNDQFDRFSAPIERRYTRAQVWGWFERAGMQGVAVRAHYGWVGTGRRPADGAPCDAGTREEAVESAMSRLAEV